MIDDLIINIGIDARESSVMTNIVINVVGEGRCTLQVMQTTITRNKRAACDRDTVELSPCVVDILVVEKFDFLTTSIAFVVETCEVIGY